MMVKSDEMLLPKVVVSLLAVDEVRFLSYSLVIYQMSITLSGFFVRHAKALFFQRVRIPSGNFRSDR
jgi:hypothetical protein